MKRTLLFLLAGTALTLSAQEGQSYGTIELGGAFRRDTNQFKSGLTYGLGTGHWFSNQWGLDFKALRTDHEVRSTGTSTHEYLGLGSVLYNLRPGANWNPYLSAGLGGTRVHKPLASGDESKVNFHVGAGLFGHLDERWIAQFDVKAVRVPLSSSHHSEILALAGIGYTWGGAKKAAPAPVAAPVLAPAPKPAPVVAPPPPPVPAPTQASPKAADKAVQAPPPAQVMLDETVVHFANAKAELVPEAIAAIQKVADGLKAFKGDYSVKVRGHASSPGSRAGNKAISKRRAKVTARALVASGVPASKVTTEGLGQDKPVADNATKAGQAKNRRTEIEVKVIDGKAEVSKIDTGLVETAAAPRKKASKKK